MEDRTPHVPQSVFSPEQEAALADQAARRMPPGVVGEGPVAEALAEQLGVELRPHKEQD